MAEIAKCSTDLPKRTLLIKKKNLIENIVLNENERKCSLVSLDCSYFYLRTLCIILNIAGKKGILESEFFKRISFKS